VRSVPDYLISKQDRISKFNKCSWRGFCQAYAQSSAELLIAAESIERSAVHYLIGKSGLLKVSDVFGEKVGFRAELPHECEGRLIYDSLIGCRSFKVILRLRNFGF
jgi:hypothetical protein